jgi:hypothetical protein
VLQRLVVDPSRRSVAVIDKGEPRLRRRHGHRAGQDRSRFSGGS